MPARPRDEFAEDANPRAPEDRNRRQRAVRSTTLSARRATKRELEIGRLLYPEAIEGRPKTRGECVAAERPCPFVGCKYHLFLDVEPRNGSLKLNFPDLEPEDLVRSCALDVADDGRHRLEEVGVYTNLTRERVRQLEKRALQRLAEQSEVIRLAREEEVLP